MPKKLKVDLHAHTSEDLYEKISYDAFQLIDTASQKGFDVLAITNHNFVTHNKKIVSYAEKKGILLISGMEAIFSGRHILIINPDFKQNPSGGSLKELPKIKTDKNLIIAPHPFFLTLKSLRSDLFPYIHYFDAIEFSHYYNHFINCNKKAIRVAQKYKKPLVATSDCHFLREFGLNYSLVEAEKEPLCIIEAIKTGKIELCTTSLSLFATFRIVLNFMLLKRYKKPHKR